MCIYCSGCNWNGGYPCSSRSACSEFDLSDEGICKDCEDRRDCGFIVDEVYPKKQT